jgi:hypothetical protein
MKKLLLLSALLVSFSSFGQDFMLNQLDGIVIDTTNYTFQIKKKNEIKKGKIIINKNLKLGNINIRDLAYYSIEFTFGRQQNWSTIFDTAKSMELTIGELCDTKLYKDNCTYSTKIDITHMNSANYFVKHFFNNEFEYLGTSTKPDIWNKN